MAEENKAPKVVNISNSVSRLETFNSLTDTALKGLDYYVKLKGSEEKLQINNAFKIANANVKNLSWKTATPDDYERAIGSVNNLSINVENLSDSNKSFVEQTAGYLNAKINKEQSLRSKADGIEADLNGLIDEANKLATTEIGASQFNFNEFTAMIQDIKDQYASNIESMDASVSEKTLSELANLQDSAQSRLLLDAIDADETKKGIQILPDTERFVQPTLESLGCKAEELSPSISINDTQDVSNLNFILGDEGLQTQNIDVAKDMYKKGEKGLVDYVEQTQKTDVEKLLTTIRIGTQSPGSTEEQVFTRGVMEQFLRGGDEPLNKNITPSMLNYANALKNAAEQDESIYKTISDLAKVSYKQSERLIESGTLLNQKEIESTARDVITSVQDFNLGVKQENKIAISSQEDFLTVPRQNELKADVTLSINNLLNNFADFVSGPSEAAGGFFGKDALGKKETKLFENLKSNTMVDVRSGYSSLTDLSKLYLSPNGVPLKTAEIDDIFEGNTKNVKTFYELLRIYSKLDLLVPTVSNKKSPFSN
jgi:hypothetical protein